MPLSHDSPLDYPCFFAPLDLKQHEVIDLISRNGRFTAHWSAAREVGV
jgi:hypothetical protein